MPRQYRRSLDDDIADLLGEKPPPRTNKGKGKWMTPAMMRQVCLWIAKGKTVRSFCQQPGTPAARTVYSWLDKDPVFAEEFRTARLIGHDMLAQECLDIADSGNELNIKHRRLQIWTRLQLLARWDTARYGERIQVGGDGALPLRLQVMSDDDVMSKVMELLATAKKRQLRDPNNRFGQELLN